MTAILIDAQPKQTSRPKPGPGHQVAAPEPDACAPWAAVLEHTLTPGRFHWVMSEEGALIPVPVADDEATRIGKRSAFTARLAGLLHR